MFHPDTAYEIFRSFQAERLQEAEISRQLNQQTAARSTLRARFLFRSGELMIALGTNLKAHAHSPRRSELPA